MIEIFEREFVTWLLYENVEHPVNMKNNSKIDNGYSLSFTEFLYTMKYNKKRLENL